MKTISSLFILLFCLLGSIQARDASVSDNPDTLILEQPTQGATGISINPQLVWHYQPGDLYYREQVALDSLFSEIVSDTSILGVSGIIVGPLIYNTKYYWHVNGTQDDCTDSCTSPWSVTFHFTTETSSAIIPQFSIQRLTLSTGSAIQFTLPQNSFVQIQIYDLKGSVVKTLVDEVRETGSYTMLLDPKFFLEHYLLDFNAGNFHKMIML